MLIHRTLLIAKAYIGFVCLPKLWQNWSQYKPMERVGFRFWFIILGQKTHFIFISTVHFMLIVNELRHLKALALVPFLGDFPSPSF